MAETPRFENHGISLPRAAGQGGDKIRTRPDVAPGSPVEAGGRRARSDMRQKLAEGSGAKVEARRGLSDGWLWRPIECDGLDGRLARLFEIEAKIRCRLRTGRKPSSESVAQYLNSAHRLGLTESYVSAHREEWGPLKIAKVAPEKLGALRHSEATRLVLATGATP